MMRRSFSNFLHIICPKHKDFQQLHYKYPLTYSRLRYLTCQWRSLHTSPLSSRLDGEQQPPTSFINKKWKNIDLQEFTLDKIRNFSIIAHVDHGKSTLADRILEHVGAIKKHSSNAKDEIGSVANKQVLDKLKVERERGITIKAQTASLLYNYTSQNCSDIDTNLFLLNLIDTPGHVDFHSEVSRSLSACQGVVLLIDASQGIQAQTLSNFYLAFDKSLTIIPVLNKIDLPHAKPEEVKFQLQNVLDISPSDVLSVSAKTGEGVEELLCAVVERIPNPSHGRSKKCEDCATDVIRVRDTNDMSCLNTPQHEMNEALTGPQSNLRFIIQDSWFERYRGVVNLVQIIDGRLSINNSVTSLFTKKSYVVKSIEILTPSIHEVDVLYAGQMGVIITNMKLSTDSIIGDTFVKSSTPETDLSKTVLMAAKPWLETWIPKPMIFCGLFPSNPKDYLSVKSALDHLCLNDSSVTISGESSGALGGGWRLGFLGVLHMEVFSQRLDSEHGVSVISTLPSVTYEVSLSSGEVKKITKPGDWYEGGKSLNVKEIREPIVSANIIVPTEFISSITSLCTSHRGKCVSSTFMDQTRLQMCFSLPLNSIVMDDFFDSLKRVSSGYASFDYDDSNISFEPSKIVKVDIRISGENVEELSFLSHLSSARPQSLRLLSRLKSHLDRQLFTVVIQAVIGSKVICREEVKAMRKDVTAKCYGGDLTRKAKLLKNQALGKQRMKENFKFSIPHSTLVNVLKK